MSDKTMLMTLCGVVGGGVVVTFVALLFTGGKTPAQPAAPKTQARAAAPPQKRPAGTPIPEDVTYEIVAKNDNPDGKNSIYVRLSRKVRADVLVSIARELKGSDPQTLMKYYLADAEPGDGCWATSLFDPDLKVRILGTPAEPDRNKKRTFEYAAISAASSNRAWYSGGTLHQSKMSEWSRATYANRLATASDFVVKLMQVDGMTIPPVAEIKPLAELMERNISAANTNALADSQKVSTMAATCWILMKQ